MVSLNVAHEGLLFKIDVLIVENVFSLSESEKCHIEKIVSSFPMTNTFEI